MQNLSGRTVIVTGGSKGIGRILALRLANEKANIVITGRDNNALTKTKNEIAAINQNVLAVNADASVYSDVKKVINETIQKFNDIHFLINNAGNVTHKAFEDFDVAQWKTVIETNLLGPMMMCKEVLPYMKKLSGTTGATIVNIASTAGKRGYEGGTAYSASKFALVGFSESLFKEVRKHNIRVCIVYPSAVDTDVKEESALKEIGKGVYMRAEDVADSILLAMKLPQRAMLKEVEIWGTNP